MYKDIYPKEWNDIMPFKDTHIEEFNTLQHFKQRVKDLKQKEDNKCGISYADAVKDLLTSNYCMEEKEYDIIKNNVKNVFLKRGLISETIYESYRYDVEGELVDVAKVIAEDPACCLVPNKSYKNYFYELYISISYSHNHSNKEVMEGMAKILATVELLEKEHYFCKITLVMPNHRCNEGNGKPNYFGIIPLFSHKEHKNIKTMSSVLNDRLLRKFFFALWEEKYGKYLDSGYGNAIELPYTIRPVEVDEVDLCSNILNQIHEKGKR
jgi:hypothetical protein